MGIETITRGLKKSYEEFKLQETQRGIDKLLFPTQDIDTSAGFLLDRLIDTPFGIVYRDKDNQSHVMPYRPGNGTLYDIPISSEKTPVDEELRDAVISGIEANGAYSQHAVKLVNDIMKMYPVGKLPPIKVMSMRDKKEIEDVIKGPLNGGKHLYTLGYPT